MPTMAENAARVAPIKAEVARLWPTGMSSGAIAKAIGITKNAVIGHVNRMGLPRRPSPIKRDAVRNPRPCDRPVPIKVVPKLADLMCFAPPAIEPPVAPEPVAVKPAQRHARTRTAARTTCCWPIGHPGTEGFRFCEAAADAGQSYCAEHHAVAYVKVRPLREIAA